MEIPLNNNNLVKFMSDKEDKNHLFVLENLLRDMLPPYASNKCKLFAFLTNSGNVTVVLEAINAGNHELCSDALVKLGATIHNQSFSGHPKFKIAHSSIFDPGSWVKNKILSVQDRIINSPNEIKDVVVNKAGEELLELDDYVDQEKSGAQFIHIRFPFLISCLSVILLINTIT